MPGMPSGSEYFACESAYDENDPFAGLCGLNETLGESIKSVLEDDSLSFGKEFWSGLLEVSEASLENTAKIRKAFSAGSLALVKELCVSSTVVRESDLFDFLQSDSEFLGKLTLEDFRNMASCLNPPKSFSESIDHRAAQALLEVWFDRADVEISEKVWRDLLESCGFSSHAHPRKDSDYFEILAKMAASEKLFDKFRLELYAFYSEERSSKVGGCLSLENDSDGERLKKDFEKNIIGESKNELEDHFERVSNEVSAILSLDLAKFDLKDLLKHADRVEIAVDHLIQREIPAREGGGESLLQNLHGVRLNYEIKETSAHSV